MGPGPIWFHEKKLQVLSQTCRAEEVRGGHCTLGGPRSRQEGGRKLGESIDAGFSDRDAVSG